MLFKFIFLIYYFCHASNLDWQLGAKMPNGDESKWQTNLEPLGNLVDTMWNQFEGREVLFMFIENLGLRKAKMSKHAFWPLTGSLKTSGNLMPSIAWRGKKEGKKEKQCLDPLGCETWGLFGPLFDVLSRLRLFPCFLLFSNYTCDLRNMVQCRRHGFRTPETRTDFILHKLRTHAQNNLKGHLKSFDTSCMCSRNNEACLNLRLSTGPDQNPNPHHAISFSFS